ncbi:hypothetical protein BX661DRAFT_189219 [Kickxella alabastrina]|uniref:uncharacterized protein n=1 Tax=Kickxella alabastrina TaxID=61397 RepID=UPI00221F74AA|nr:uncharacterized protein BX661DRAFT_189219 [Kickxella alabastrina]KAI7820372.1 hypothetical protein BX661DRAFT_189219 [Kickxella alabastrina]
MISVNIGEKKGGMALYCTFKADFIIFATLHALCPRNVFAAKGGHCLCMSTIPLPSIYLPVYGTALAPKLFYSPPLFYFVLWHKKKSET